MTKIILTLCINVFLHIISQVTSTPNMLISQIDIVTPYEKKQILFDFNNTKTQYPKDKTVAELFEEQVDYHLLKMQYFLKEII